ncbi:MAG: RNA polymerase sigma factor [Thermoanaerobaculia bacterium]
MAVREGAGRGLTPDSFEALLAMLHTDREIAGQRYEEIRRRLVRLFEWRGCAHSEELADETFNRVARKSAEGLALQRSDPYAYFCGVAHHVFQEVVRREARQHKALESSDWTASDPAEDEPDYRLDHLRACLQTLEAEQRRLLLRYHQEDQRIRSRKDLCDELGIPMNALRIRVHRLRRKVEACVQEKLRN